MFLQEYDIYLSISRVIVKAILTDELALILPLEGHWWDIQLSQKMFVQKVHFLTILAPGLGEILQAEHW